MRIAFVVPDQHEALVDLMHEMCVFYSEEAPAARDDVRSNLHENLLAPGSPVRIVVAADELGDVVGLAAIALFHSLVDPAPRRRGQLLLKELYVRRARQGEGIGRALMSWVARHALEHGCARMDWNVSASNREGLAFYRSLGALHVAGRLSFRLGGEFLARLANGDQDDTRY
ncbi:GNAT family N-acetyltransferase [Scleromatobacter humisilvae]|uniref:GNAT family N-acetyltransferase n=1 Tax=Scleromatobacter humisilvae TaxID=2897159 RepID=A0A9X1YHM5_9BURK|nr:GNAT family N-acetyltransferase [Scleromatobacter humisilvae]MCK9685045.1 GNAT family N-acetyltransferase [Scleromatobacter humisilvae]